MQPDSLTFAALLDSLRAIVPNTIVASLVDTVVVSISDKVKVDAPFDTLQLLLTLVGWGLVFWFQRKLQKALLARQAEHQSAALAEQRSAQKEQFRDEVLLDAWARVGTSIDEFLFWLEHYASMFEFFPRDAAEGLKRLQEHRKNKAAGQWWGEIRVHDFFFPGLEDAARPLRNRHVEIRDRTTRILADSMVPHVGGVHVLDDQVFRGLLAVAVNDLNELYRDVDAFRARWQSHIYRNIFHGLLPTTWPAPAASDTTDVQTGGDVL